MFCSLPLAFLLTSLTLPLTSSKSLAPGAHGKGCNFVNIKSHFCLQEAATKKLSRISPHPFSFWVFFFFPPSSGQTDKQTRCRTLILRGILSVSRAWLAYFSSSINSSKWVSLQLFTSDTALGCFLWSLQWLPIP